MMAVAVSAQIREFEVASIKPCKVEPTAGRAGSQRATSPGTLCSDCAPVRAFIQEAYLIYADGRLHDYNWYDVPVEGAPGWIQNERYKIEAKAEQPEPEGVMKSPMLRRLLEDRFQLKIRRETREVPVYELVVAKSGAKLQPFDRSCKPVDGERAPGPGECRNFAGSSGPNMTRYWQGIRIDEFVAAILDKQFAGRPVINKTGISGLFDIHLSFSSEAETGTPDAGPSIFTAIQQQLGLRLVPSKGPGKFLVVTTSKGPTERPLPFVTMN